MKKAILVALFGALALTANAGDWSGKALVNDKNPKAPIGCPDTFGEVSIGYMTDYILHGARINRDTVWLDANYAFDSLIPVTVGVSHFSGINDFNGATIDETDVYARVAMASIGGFDLTLGYTHRFMSLAGGSGSFGEVNLIVRRDIGFADLVLGSSYGINSSALFGTGGDGWYHSAGIEKDIALSDSISIVLGAGVGYHDGYFYNNSGWSNYYAKASLPIKINCSATLTPYIGYNGVQQWDQYDFQGDALHAGISLNVTF